MEKNQFQTALEEVYEIAWQAVHDLLCHPERSLGSQSVLLLEALVAIEGRVEDERESEAWNQ